MSKVKTFLLGATVVGSMQKKSVCVSLELQRCLDRISDSLSSQLEQNTEAHFHVLQQQSCGALVLSG